MTFNDSYEYETNGITYYVSIQGSKLRIEGKTLTDIDHIEIFDELGNLVESDHEAYDDIYEDALGREFELEVHGSDFDYYEEVG